MLLLTLSGALAASVDIYCVVNNLAARWLLLSSGTFLFSQLGIMFAAWKLNLLSIVPLALSKVFQGFPDPLFVIDRDNKIRMVNRSASHFFSLKEVIGKSFDEVLPQVPLVDGELNLADRFFILNLEKLERNEDNFSGSIVIFKEITKQKIVEKKLNESLDFKAKLLALVSHDLSGQLESQAILSTSLQESVQGTSLKDKVAVLASSAVASQGFMHNLMSWVKGIGQQFDLSHKEFEWNILIKECIENLEFACRPKKITIHFESNISPLIGHGDSYMMESVVRNIISNAIKASSSEGVIYVLLQQVDGRVEVTVTDSGVGIDVEQLILLNKNESNLNLNHELSSNQGYGIGLKIAKYFLKLHSGSLFIESSLGLGTRVNFSLPLGEKPSEDLS